MTVKPLKLVNAEDGEEHLLSLPDQLIGRDDSCHVVISKGYPSRQHARVYEDRGQWMIQDLNSTNGTFVNNRQIQQATPVVIGDVIRLGTETWYLACAAGEDRTILAPRLGAAASDCGIIIDEAPGSDLTCIQEAYPLPSGWERQRDDDARRSLELVDRVLERAFAKRDKLPTAALVFCRGQRMPSVFGISPGSGLRSWGIGRHSDQPIRIDDPTISRLHARVEHEGDEWRIVDVESTNGIRSDGSMKNSVILRDGDSVHLGRIEMVFRLLPPRR